MSSSCLVRCPRCGCYMQQFLEYRFGCAYMRYVCACGFSPTESTTAVNKTISTDNSRLTSLSRNITTPVSQFNIQSLPASTYII